MNMFARFDENPAMTLRVIKETKRYGRTDGRTDGRTHGRTDNVKTVYPLQTKFAGGIIISTLSLLFSSQFSCADLKIRVHTEKLFFSFLNQNICCGYSKEPSQ